MHLDILKQSTTSLIFAPLIIVICDPFLFDVPLLRKRLVERGLSTLVLEGDYTPGTLGRVRTRIEAFIEMLRENVRAA